MEQLITALLQQLQDAGVHATAALPANVAPRLDAPACAVRLAGAKLLSPGFGQYLGVLQDPEHGETELYGAKVEAEASIRIYGPTSAGAAACESLRSRILETLLSPASCISLGRIVSEPCVYDAKYDHFSAELRVTMQSWIYAQTEDAPQFFTSYNLKGDLT